MESETTVAQGLRISTEQEKLDAACKRILSEKPVLAHIMKECLPEYKDCNINDIIEKYIEGQPQVSTIPAMPDETNPAIISGLDTEDKSLHEGTVFYDICFYALAPETEKQFIRLIINVEAQNNFYPGYPLTKRGIYYACRMISSQYGRVFQDSEYDKLQKVYSIWICMNPPKYRGNTITSYHLTENNLVGDVIEPTQHYDLLSVIMICLGGPEAKNYKGVLRMLDILFSNEVSLKDKQTILQDDYGIQMTQALEKEVLDVCNLSMGYEQRGEQRGIIQTNAANIKSLMQTLKLPIEKAMDALNIPAKDRPKYTEIIFNSKKQTK